MNEHVEFLSDLVYKLYKRNKLSVHDLYEYLKQLDDLNNLIYDNIED